MLRSTSSGTLQWLPPTLLPHKPYLSVVSKYGFQARFSLCEEFIAFVGHKIDSIRLEPEAIGVALQRQPRRFD